MYIIPPASPPTVRGRKFAVLLLLDAGDGLARRMNAASRFFDANVLVYLLSGDQAKANAAETLVASGGIVSVQVLNEFASATTRKLHMLIPEVREVLGTVRRLCTVYMPLFEPRVPRLANLRENRDLLAARESVLRPPVSSSPRRPRHQIITRRAP